MERTSLGEHTRDWYLMLTVAHPNRRSKTHTHGCLAMVMQDINKN